MRKSFIISVSLILLSVMILVFPKKTIAQPMMHRMMDYDESERLNYRGTMGWNMMGYGMMGFGMMMGNMGCPTMMNYLGSVDLYLSLDSELDFSNKQVGKLEQIRETYQKNAIDKSAELMKKMFELNSLLRKDDIDLSMVKKLNIEIEKIQTELRYNNLEGYVKARNILNKKQLNRLKSMWFRGYQGEKIQRHR